MINVLLIFTLLMFCFCMVLLYYIYVLEDEVKRLDSVQKSQNTSIITLLYHQSIRCEDYEATKKIKELMGKDFNFYKMM
jgi:hypothetical protein